MFNLGHIIETSASLHVHSSELSAISPFTRGYCLVNQPQNCYSSDVLKEYMSAILALDKTIVLRHCDGPTVRTSLALAAEVTGIQVIEVFNERCYILNSIYDCHSYPDRLKDQTIFLISDRYLTERFIVSSSQQSPLMYRQQDSSPIQLVHFAGLAPSPQMLTPDMIATIESSPRTILFDRTLQNIVSQVRFPGERYVVPFNYEYFDANLLALNLLLAALQAAGALEVTVLIEGDPQIYDYAEGLSTRRRRFSFSPAVPLVLLACRRVEITYGFTLVDPGYILTSGFNVRQGVTSQRLCDELDVYLSTSLTIMVMEMYCGDLPLVLSRIARSPRVKSVIILTNMYSQHERIYYMANSELGMIQWLDSIKGKFTTLIVVDEASKGIPEALRTL